MEYKVGQIMLCNYSHLYSKLIRIYNKRKYGFEGWAHAAIITEDRGDKFLVHEALGKGVVESEYDKVWLDEQVQAGIIHIREASLPLVNVKEVADTYLGRGYAWLDILSIGASLVLGKWSIHLTGAKHVICSEYVARILYDCSNKKINFETEFNKDYDLITPTDLSITTQLHD